MATPTPKPCFICGDPGYYQLYRSFAEPLWRCKIHYELDTVCREGRGGMPCLKTGEQARDCRSCR